MRNQFQRPKSHCRITHPQIAKGSCPWCAIPIVDGRVHTDRTAMGRGVERWNLSRMIDDLACLEEESRLTTITNVLDNNVLEAVPLPRQALALLNLALVDKCPQVRDHANQALFRLRRNLGPDIKGYAEAAYAHDQSNYAALGLLLSCLCTERFQSVEAARTYYGLVLNLIERMPRHSLTTSPLSTLIPSVDGVAYQAAHLLWMHHIQNSPNDSELLANAASFFSRSKPNISVALLTRCKVIQPHEGRWSWELGHLHSLKWRNESAEGRQHWAALALSELEIAYSSTDALTSNIHLLIDLCKSSFNAGNTDKASRYAELALQPILCDANPRVAGYAVHQANMVLGRIHVIRAEFGMATSRLRNSLTPRLKTQSQFFGLAGPNTALVADLLRAGVRREPMLFLSACREFWKSGNDRLELWLTEIALDRLPEFGANNYL